jgi:hypothetical protein
MKKLTPAQRQLIASRQALRLHIESMDITRDELRQRAKYHKTDPMNYKTAKRAVTRLGNKIAKARQELGFLESKWTF